MSLITLTPGNYLVPFIGASPASIAAQSWFTAANVNIGRPSANRAGYVKNLGGSSQSFAFFTQFIPSPVGGVPEAYIFEVLQSFAIDSTLFGAPVLAPSRLLFTLAPNQTAQVNAFTIATGDDGSYLIENSAGLTSLSYTKNGTALTTLSTTVPVALAVGDVFGLTATTSTITGTLGLIKQ